MTAAGWRLARSWRKLSRTQRTVSSLSKPEHADQRLLPEPARHGDGVEEASSTTEGFVRGCWTVLLARSEVDGHPRRPDLRFELTTPRRVGSLRSKRLQGEVCEGLRKCVDQGDESWNPGNVQALNADPTGNKQLRILYCIWPAPSLHEKRGPSFCIAHETLSEVQFKWIIQETNVLEDSEHHEDHV